MHASLRFTILILLLSVGCETTTDRHAEVAERGAHVMPFDLDRTTHIFEKLESGGRQQVVSDDVDAEQIQLIQSHLVDLAQRFNQGDFHSPAMIHGTGMPGLHELVQGHERLLIEYSALEHGGQILYTSEDTVMVAALHAWFDAQLSDHGHHAQDHH